MDKNEIWQQALEALLADVDPDNPKSVFLPLLTPFGIFGDQYILLAENQYVESWVNKNFIDEIQQAVSSIAGQQFHIGISSKTAIEPARTQVNIPAADNLQSAAPTFDAAGSAAQAANNTVAVPVGQAGGQQNTTFPFVASTPAEETPAQPEWMNTYVDPAEFYTPSEQASPATTTVSAANSGEDRELLERCTFDTFVVGQSNELARGAALAVAEQPGVAYNPLFIYGKSGLGKTHLLISIANYINQNLPHLRTLYVPADTFTSDYIDSIQMKNMPAFNEKYYTVDVLLIDDVQRLENRGETVNQLFNIFNKMTSNNKQIVLSADRSPKEIDLDERMRSRFVQGLTADIKQPDFETRLAIIKNLIAREEERSPFYAVISDEVQNWLAEITVPTIRDIQGAITRLVGYMSLGKRTSLSVDEAKEILQDFFPDRANKQITVAAIQKEVERYFDVSHEDIVSAKRSKVVTYPRHVAIYLSRYMTEESLESIGRKFGNRDHTTIMHSVNKIEKEQNNNPVLFDQIQQLRSRINERL